MSPQLTERGDLERHEARGTATKESDSMTKIHQNAIIERYRRCIVTVISTRALLLVIRTCILPPRDNVKLYGVIFKGRFFRVNGSLRTSSSTFITGTRGYINALSGCVCGVVRL